MPRKSATATAEAQEPVNESTERVGFDFEETLAALRQPIPDDHIRQRQGWKDRNGNYKMVDYIEWHTVADILDNVAVEWAHEIKSIQVAEGWVIVVAAIYVNGVCREGVGVGEIGRGDMGIKKAASDALKRAAVMFGVGRELYYKDEEPHVDYNQGGGYPRDYSQYPNQGGVPQQYAPKQMPADVYARSAQDAMSESQGKMIYAICKQHNWDENALLQQHTGASDKRQLNKTAASAFIDILKQMENGGQQTGRLPDNRSPQLPPPMPQYTGMGAPQSQFQQPQPPPVQLGNPATFPQGVTQGMPPQQEASVAQGQFADSRIVNSLKILMHKKGMDAGQQENLANQYSNGRTRDVAQLSQTECEAAHNAVAAL